MRIGSRKPVDLQSCRLKTALQLLPSLLPLPHFSLSRYVVQALAALAAIPSSKRVTFVFAAPAVEGEGEDTLASDFEQDPG